MEQEIILAGKRVGQTRFWQPDEKEQEKGHDDLGDNFWQDNDFGAFCCHYHFPPEPPNEKGPQTATYFTWDQNFLNREPVQELEWSSYNVLANFRSEKEKKEEHKVNKC
ncbi:hypothetical protein G9A89_017874 [Geosiphon pyriformis]|nr:hypothetical protein G9A89_017874 [Geosiphon pyriformis]